MIAMALANEPKLLIADEPTTALDVTIQAQILALLDDLKDRLGMAMLLITHDMGVIAGHADRVNVMYAGRIVETADVRDLFSHMHHPYTQALLASIPRLTQESAEALHAIPGLPPDLAHLPQGCRFAARCTRATDKCREDGAVAERQDRRPPVLLLAPGGRPARAEGGRPRRPGRGQHRARHRRRGHGRRDRGRGRAGHRSARRDAGGRRRAGRSPDGGPGGRRRAGRG